MLHWSELLGVYFMLLFRLFADKIKKCIDEKYHHLVSVEPPKNIEFGDFSTNIALRLSAHLASSPMQIAEQLLQQLQVDPDFQDINIKKPGFINWKVPLNLLLRCLPHMLKNDYGRLDLGNGNKVNIEYVSANPTGPLHVGHVRGAISGDVLARLLSFVGYDVTKEFYINDAGRQVDNLAHSVYWRYCQLLGQDLNNDVEYPGEYLIPVAEDLISTYGDKFLNSPEKEWIDLFKMTAIDSMLSCIKKDLADLGVFHDVFYSERELVVNGEVDKVIQTLQDKDLLYRGILDLPKGSDAEDWEQREQLLFRSSSFGDDVDRPLQKADGSWTYFATDIAYHKTKIDRGFSILIDFWGADHGGYVKRMQAAVHALSNATIPLEVQLIQMARLLENGREVKMSKRAGTFVSARDILDKVGKDVVRFIMLTRRNDAPLDFDFAKVVEQSRDNPVFYVQYAYARINSVLKMFASTLPDHSIKEPTDSDFIDTPEYWPLIKTLADWPRQVMMAAQHHEPHRLAFYIGEVASTFHSLWNCGKEKEILRFILPNDIAKTCARMYLLTATRNVLNLAFELMGITPVEELR